MVVRLAIRILFIVTTCGFVKKKIEYYLQRLFTTAMLSGL